MPEGHSVRRLADTFESRFLNEPVHASSPQGRFAEGASVIDGQTLREVDAHGKHMFLRFGEETWLRIHLGMFGKWRFASRGPRGKRRRAGIVAQGDRVEAVDPAPPVGAVRLRLTTPHDVADVTGPAACALMSAAERTVFLKRLGEDPLRDDADPARAFERISRSRMSIAALLMRQDIVAGIGNIYRAEILFRNGIEPHKPGRDVSPTQWGAIWADALALLREGVRLGRIVTTRPGDRPKYKTRVSRSDAFYVAHRNGRPCRICGTPVRSEIMAGRKLYWCETCQRS